MVFTLPQDHEDQFFQNLPAISTFADAANFDRYIPLPEPWVLALADVVESGKAIDSGRYKQVNMAGASIITALLNGLGNRNYPFVFGGDGAMVALPAHASSQARDILSALQVWVAEALKLDLRAAIIPIERVRDAGLDVVVARYQASGNVSYAMFAGGGATWAEAQMKAGNFSVSPAAAGSKPDLTADSDVKPAGIPINYRPPFRFEAGHDSNQLPASSRL